MHAPYYLKEVIDNSNKELFTVISTFAGGGGSSTGYRLAGAKILCVIEFVEAAQETYKANYPNTPVLPNDIKELTGEDFLKAAGLKKGELDILDGSPPCSAFSVAGKREKGWDQTKTYSDGKKVENIEDLFFEFTRIAGEIMPKVIIGENVAGITMGEAKEYFNRIVNEFGKLGYEAVGKVLNAADYGTPQGRQRCFFVAVRNDVMDKVGMNFMTMENEVYPEPLDTKVSLKEAIENVVSDESQEKELFEYVQKGFQKKWVEILPFNPTRHTKPSENDMRIIPKDKWEEYKNMGFKEKNAKPIITNSDTKIEQLYKKEVKHYEWDTDKDYYYIDINYKKSMFNMIRPAPNLPCPTLTQRGQQMSVSGVFHYDKNRKFTIPELKRIMGLPDDYKLEGTFDKQAERIGRMVAPLMMKNLSQNIYEKVIKPYNIEQNKNIPPENPSNITAK
jgi:DNA (cytosine-5)-methyltransferase 1